MWAIPNKTERITIFLKIRVSEFPSAQTCLGILHPSCVWSSSHPISWRPSEPLSVCPDKNGQLPCCLQTSSPVWETDSRSGPSTSRPCIPWKAGIKKEGSQRFRGDGGGKWALCGAAPNNVQLENVETSSACIEERGSHHAQNPSCIYSP